MADTQTKPITEGSNMAVETTSVAPETEDTATQADEGPASEAEAAAQLGNFA